MNEWMSVICCSCENESICRKNEKKICRKGKMYREVYQKCVDVMENNIKEVSEKIEIIKSAIKDVSGIDFYYYTKPGKNREMFFLRMIFAYQCRKLEMTEENISNYVNRKRVTIHYYLYLYPDEYKTNKYFRNIAEKIELKIKSENNHESVHN